MKFSKEEQWRRGISGKNNPAYKHGMKGTRLYNIWHSMKQRCYRKNNKDYERYGGRGIRICSEWLNDFKAFYNWSILNGYADDLTIDRIDTNGNYEPDNCRWVSVKVQNNNRRSCKLIEYNGEVHNLSQWSLLLGINEITLGARLNKGWSVERAFTEPVHKEFASR